MAPLSSSSQMRFPFRDPADAVCPEVCVPCLDAAKTAQVLVTLLLPLCDQILVSDVFSQAKLVQLCNDIIKLSGTNLVRLQQMDSFRPIVPLETLVSSWGCWKD
uniref:Uncharacterized protein n=1 Tax=Timema cristinae TaxID=61476 RepID=A0A7R9DE41_TIMCR|nr:unnamed protein product [Timema cristinae]